MNKTAREFRKENSLGTLCDIDKAMHEFAEQQSIAFAKWIHLSGYRPVTDPMDLVVIYERNCSRFSVEELYEIFLKRK